MQLKDKTCLVCKIKFTPTKPLQRVCSYECAITYTLAEKEKKMRSEALKLRRETKVKREKLKTLSQHKKELQTIFNLFIRLRDAENPCISCNRFHTGQYHAGHYRSVGSAPHLRFCELNVHRQCSVCNNHFSGNAINYRQGLIKKIGVLEVEAVEADQTLRHYTIENINQLKIHYRLEIKKMQKLKQGSI